MPSDMGRPTGRGLYWFRAHADCQPWSQTTSIAGCVGRWIGVEIMERHPSGGLVAAWPGDEALVDVDRLRGDWCGPLPEPPQGA